MSVLIPVPRLRQFSDPFSDNPWEGRRFSIDTVLRAVDAGRFETRAWSETNYKARYSHVARIAWLAVVGWEDPIQIDVGIPWMGCWVRFPVQDGNHRLAAAIVRNDESIPADVAGCMRTARELFGVNCTRQKAARRA